MSSAVETAPKHIPAWKKLGLKLKYAKDELSDHEGRQKNDTNAKKRKDTSDEHSLNGSTPDEKPIKKSKKSKSKTEGSIATVESNNSHVSINDGKENSNSTLQTSPRPKRKAVSFTPETKAQDGDSVKSLYKSWLASQVAKDPSFDISTASPALKSITPITVASSKTLSPTSASSPTPKKAKTKAKAKTKTKTKTKSRNPSPNSDRSEPLPALTYLQTYHKDHKNWKFSKPHQNHLLKHLFSNTYIPPSHDPALLFYLRGLQGSARSRVRKEALAIREGDEKWLQEEKGEVMDQETDAQCKARRRRDYEGAVKRMREMLEALEDEREEREWELLGEKEEWEKRFHMRKRAELVLWGVGDQENGVEDAGAQSKDDSDGGRNKQVTNGGGSMIQANGSSGEMKRGTRGTVGNGKRKRKWRRPATGVPDDESSSESSSSSSSSEKSQKEGPVAKKGRMNGNMESSDDKTSSSD